MFHHGQRVRIIMNEENRLCYPRDFFVVLTEEEDASYYPNGKPSIIATGNIYHNHQLQKMTVEERIAEYKKGFKSKLNLMRFFTHLVVPVDSCRNANAASKLEGIDD